MASVNLGFQTDRVLVYELSMYEAGIFRKKRFLSVGTHATKF
jgi:hypothetical protein